MLALSALAFSQVACTAGQITGTLEFAVDAYASFEAVAAPNSADAAFAVIAGQCLNNATSELDSTDTNLQKFTAVTAECLAASEGVPGLSIGGKALVNAIGSFLNNIKTLESLRFDPRFRKFANAYANSTDARIDKKALKRIKKKLAKLPPVK